jgi:DNA-binding CsgD family transcriptional regulator
VALTVAQGKTNREAGAILYISPKTVEFHLSQVYRKLVVRSRAELAAQVARLEGVASRAAAVGGAPVAAASHSLP